MKPPDMLIPGARNTLGLLFALGLMMFFPAKSSADPGLPDSIIVESVSFQKGDPAFVEIWTVSDEWLTGMELTITWDWTNMTADDFVFSPTRFDPAVVKGFTPYLNNLTIFAFPTNDSLISPGRQLLGTITFGYPDTAQARTVTVDTTTLYLNDSLLIRANLFTDTLSSEPFIPSFAPAQLVMNICCIGYSGNTDCDPEDKHNLSDITRLIDRVFLTKTPLCCEGEGNVDGDILAKINLADITRLIDNVYLSKQPTAPCM